MNQTFSIKRTFQKPLKLTLLVVLLASFSLLSAWVLGRMTGGGSFFAENGMRVTHGFELYCQQGPPFNIGPNNLQVNWGPGNRFHLDYLTANSCRMGPDPTPPDAPISVYNGCGRGSYNGTPNYYACWTFTDAGEPGRDDTAWFTLYDPTLTIELFEAGPSRLTFGNHQAHFVKGGKLPADPQP